MGEAKLLKLVIGSALILPQLRTGGIARRRGYNSLCWILAAWPVAIPLLFLTPNLRLDVRRSDLASVRLGVNALGLALSAITVSTLSLLAYNLPTVLDVVAGSWIEP
jgi:hypothetical protein